MAGARIYAFPSPHIISSLSKIIVFLIIFCPPLKVLSQDSLRYEIHVKKAYKLYQAKKFVASAFEYSSAFKIMGWKGFPEDRYNAACAWNLAGNIDSAFYQLNLLATKANFADYYRLVTDTDLATLSNDYRWRKLLLIVSKNKQKADEKLNKPLKRLLESIFIEDQKYRILITDYQKIYGSNSLEMKILWDSVERCDDSNLIKVTDILDKYGWLGADVVGYTGNSTLFLVIQHADLYTRKKYLPLLKVAVNEGKAQASSLALLEDRIALEEGKKQIYGSQINLDLTTGKYVISPIEDEMNVNKRRAAVGLEPIEEYVKYWGIVYKPMMSTLNINGEKNKNIIFALALSLILYILVTFLFYRLSKNNLFTSPWFWFYSGMLVFTFVMWYKNAVIPGSTFSSEPLKKLFNTLVNLLITIVIIVAVNTIWLKLNKTKHLVFELFSISAGIIGSFFSARLINKFFFPNDHMLYYLNHVPFLITLGGFLFIRATLFLIGFFKKLSLPQ